MGTVLNSVAQAIAYYAGPVDQEPSLAFTQARYTAFKNYYATVGGAPAVFGDSDALPPRWPSPVYNNLKWFGDGTRDKLRFNDIRDLWSSFWTAIVTTFNTATSDSVGVTLRKRALSPASAGSRGSLNREFATLVRQAIGKLDLPARLNASSAVSVAASDNLANASLRGWAEFAYGTIRSCSYREEIDGSMKRFSIGEAALIVGAVAFVLSAIVAVPLLGTGTATAGAVFSVTGLAVVLGTLVVAYDWSYRCLPALPYQLGDDLVWFTTRTLWPRADWFFSGVILASADGSDPYTAAAAPVCENYANGTFTAAWCTEELGFLDIGYNLVFILNQTWPAAIEFLDTTQIPILADLAGLVRDAGYLDAFIHVDMTDPVTFSNYWSCAAVWTSIPNLLIAIAFLYLLAQLRPLLSMFASLIMQGFYPIALALLFELNLLTALLSGGTPAAFGSAGGEEEGDEEEARPHHVGGQMRAMQQAVMCAARFQRHEAATLLGGALVRQWQSPFVRLAARWQRRVRALQNQRQQRLVYDEDEELRQLGDD